MKYCFFKLDLQNLFGRDDYYLSKAQVAKKILNVPESYILNWIRLSLLEATIVDNQKRVRIRQESIKEFQTKYISLSKISKRKGIHSKKLVQLLMNHGVNILTTNGYGKLYYRNEIEIMMEEI